MLNNVKNSVITPVGMINTKNKTGIIIKQCRKLGKYKTVNGYKNGL